jgi:hypothetical protein
MKLASLHAPLLIVALLATLTLPACSDHAPLLRLDPGASHVHGDYLGSERQLKLFVESVRLEPLRGGRHGLSSKVVANLVVLNERPGDARFRLGACHMQVDDQRFTALETQVVALPPASLTRATITFHAPLDPEAFGAATIDVEVGEGADAAKWSFPVSAVFE